MKGTISTDQKINNALLLNASFIDNLGLMHGKVGIAIYFFHLSRQTGNAIYEDYAGELIDEIYEEITLETLLDFENGLAGIGWGVEYLVQNGFIEADTDEVLEDFDHKLFQKLIYNTPDNIGLLKGLVGLGAFFIKRVQNPHNNPNSIPMLTNKQTLIHLIDELDRRLTNSQIVRLLTCETEKWENCMDKGVPNNLHNLSVQTFEPSDLQTKQSFNLLWDYPVLIVFIAELHELDIFNSKVEKILCRLIEPLNDKLNHSKLQSCRLILAFALKYLLFKTNVDGNNEVPTIQTDTFKQLIKNAPQWIAELLVVITREKLMAEIPVQDATLRYGFTGITWLYGQLYLMTNNYSYQKEADWWKRKMFDNNIPDNGFAGFSLQNEENAFGVLEGLAGIGLLSVINSKTLQTVQVAVSKYPQTFEQSQTHKRYQQ